MAWAMVAVTAVSAGVKIYQANKSAKAAEDQATEQEKEQKKQQNLLDQEKAKFKAQKFDNPYENMENVFEDLTVNQQQAQFQAQQGTQQRANIMQNLKGAAGGSGVAGLAQAMANQGQLQTQQISASIGQQEAANQKAKAQGAANIQAKEREGQKMQQQFEIDKQATLLGMQQGKSAGADTAAASANQMALQGEIAANEAVAEGVSSTLTAYGQGADWDGTGSYNEKTSGGKKTGSDRRLKKNIKLIGESPSGLNIYSFEYKDFQYGEGVFQGVMSDEIPQEAVVRMDNGYDAVDYSKLDVEFKQI